MDHVVYLDRKAGELEKLVTGEKTMIVRGAAGRKLPYGRVNAGDVLYFIENSGDGLVRARAAVKNVILSDRLTPEESHRLLLAHQDKLQLTPAQTERWGGKRYLVLVEIENLEVVDPFRVDRSAYGNMDDWLPVEDIQSVR